LRSTISNQPIRRQA